MPRGEPSARVQAWAARHGLEVSELTPEEYAAARGHRYTPEHGGGAIAGIPKVQHYAGRETRSTHSDYRVEQIVNRAADHEQRVVIKVHDSNGWHEAGGSRGYSAGYIASLTAEAGGIRSAVTGGYISGHGGGHGGGSDSLDDIDYDDVDDWQIDILE